jgi:hypothetical protein
MVIYEISQKNDVALDVKYSYKCLLLDEAQFDEAQFDEA